MNILMLDIGGSSVKMWQPLAAEPEKIETGEEFTPEDFLREVESRLGEKTPDRISIGYPGVVRWGRPAKEAINLGPGWVGFDFAQAFGRPVRIMNDAEMQALGGYQGGRMLYLGLGTGVGTTLIMVERALSKEVPDCELLPAFSNTPLLLRSGGLVAQDISKSGLVAILFVSD
jgi:polyphosphate glucokinase